MDIKIGESYQISSLHCEHIHQRKLVELGLCPGRTLRVIDKLSFGGPWIIEIAGSRFALRENEISGISLERVNSSLKTVGSL